MHTRNVLIITIFLLCPALLSAADVVRVLAIGNSFSQDAVEQYLYNLAKADSQQMIIGNLYIGGCSLERHWLNAERDSAAYSYRKIGTDGVKVTTANCKISQALADEEWDYVSLQQNSGQSGLYDTYNPYLPNLIAYVKAALPKAKIAFHQTWAYAKNSTHSDFSKYGSDQTQMYEAIVDASRRAVADNAIDLLIPSGTAVQNARTTFIGDNMNRDGYHLNIYWGRYTAACTWFESIFGKSVVGNSFRPSGVSSSQQLATQTAAHAAVLQPYAVTDLSYIQQTAGRVRFVRADASGTGDGSSWDNAMSFSHFCSTVNDYDDGDKFCFAGGTYLLPSTLAVSNGYTLVGGFSPELTGTVQDAVTYPSPTPTVFSGDLNGNGVPDAGDLRCLLRFTTSTSDGDRLRSVVLRGLEFTGVYDASGKSDEGAQDLGAVLLTDCGYVEMDSCRFYGNIGTGYYGGMAVTNQYSHLEANGCEFFDNKARARGAVLRMSSNNRAKGVTVLNRCSLHGNHVDEGVGSAILVQHGKALYIVNSTITGNSTGSYSGAIYSNGSDNTFSRSLYIVGSTVAGNTGGPQVQMTKNANLYVANSIIVGDDAPAFAVASVKDFKSGGSNVVGGE